MVLGSFLPWWSFEGEFIEILEDGDDVQDDGDNSTDNAEDTGPDEDEETEPAKFNGKLVLKGFNGFDAEIDGNASLERDVEEFLEPGRYVAFGTLFGGLAIYFFVFLGVILPIRGGRKASFVLSLILSQIYVILSIILVGLLMVLVMSGDTLGSLMGDVEIGKADSNMGMGLWLIFAGSVMLMTAGHKGIAENSKPILVDIYANRLEEKDLYNMDARIDPPVPQQPAPPDQGQFPDPRTPPSDRRFSQRPYPPQSRAPTSDIPPPPRY